MTNAVTLTDMMMVQRQRTATTRDGVVMRGTRATVAQSRRLLRIVAAGGQDYWGGWRVAAMQKTVD